MLLYKNFNILAPFPQMKLSKFAPDRELRYLPRFSAGRGRGRGGGRGRGRCFPIGNTKWMIEASCPLFVTWLFARNAYAYVATWPPTNARSTTRRTLAALKRLASFLWPGRGLYRRESTPKRRAGQNIEKRECCTKGQKDTDFVEKRGGEHKKLKTRENILAKYQC